MRAKPGFWRGVGALIVAICIELPLALLFGHHSLWQDPPLVAAAWIVGYAGVFFVLYRIVVGLNASPLNDFIRADREWRARRDALRSTLRQAPKRGARSSR